MKYILAQTNGMRKIEKLVKFLKSVALDALLIVNYLFIVCGTMHNSMVELSPDYVNAPTNK